MNNENRARIICRCEEITYGEVLDAIKAGRKSIKSIKRSTRAGMGACQGRTCVKLIMQILVEKGITDWDTLKPDKSRFPIVPVSINGVGMNMAEMEE